MNTAKTEIIKRLTEFKTFVITNKPEHKWFNVPRKAEQVQTNAVRFTGGSWLYFKDINQRNCYISDITGLSSFLLDDLIGGYFKYQEMAYSPKKVRSKKMEDSELLQKT